MSGDDARQLEAMLKAMKFHEEGKLSLHGLIGDLTFLRDVLSTVEENWEREFTSLLADVESAHSYSMEKGDGTLNEHAKPVVDRAVGKLQVMVEEKLNRARSSMCS